MANIKITEKKTKSQSMGMHSEVLTGRTQQKFFNPDEAENFYYFGTYDVDFNKRTDLDVKEMSAPEANKEIAENAKQIIELASISINLKLINDLKLQYSKLKYSCKDYRDNFDSVVLLMAKKDELFNEKIVVKLMNLKKTTSEISRSFKKSKIIEVSNLRSSVCNQVINFESKLS